MRSQTKSSGIRSWAAVACVMALLLAASVETGHVCGALRAPRPAPAGASQLEPSSGYCSICALAQPATPGPVPLALAPARSVTVASAAPEPQLSSFHTLFALNVRPPPA